MASKKESKKELKCIGYLLCPKGRYDRVWCPLYQKCIDTVIRNCLRKHMIPRTILPVLRKIQCDDEGYGMSGFMILRNIAKIAKEEKKQFTWEIIERAMKEANISEDKGSVRLEKKLIRQSFNVEKIR